MLFTPEQYVALDERSERPLEYFDGEVFEIESSNSDHGQIQFNLTVAVGKRIENSSCKGKGPATRVRVPSGRYFHPDLIVACAKQEFLPDKSLLNPSAIFEVLSDSTADFDLGRKGVLYRSIPSLQEYILIEQTRAWVQRWTRKSGSWQVDEFSGLDVVLPIATLACEIPLRELYADVEFEAEAEA